MKYVARHGRGALLKDPFSIREIGVYHKSCDEGRKSDWILLNQPEALSDRLSIAVRELDSSKPLDQFRLHVFILLHFSEDWRDYIGYLENCFTDLVRAWVLHLANLIADFPTDEPKLFLVQAPGASSRRYNGRICRYP